MHFVQGRAKKNLAKFNDTFSVRADGPCIGCPKLVGGRKAGNSNMLDFFAPRCTLPAHYLVGEEDAAHLRVLVLPLVDYGLEEESK